MKSFGDIISKVLETDKDSVLIAAQQGDAEAQFILGYFYDNGFRVDKNEKEAMCGGNSNGFIFGSNEIYIRNNCKKKVEYVMILLL